MFREFSSWVGAVGRVALSEIRVSRHWMGRLGLRFVLLLVIAACSGSLRAQSVSSENSPGQVAPSSGQNNPGSAADPSATRDAPTSAPANGSSAQKSMPKAADGTAAQAAQSVAPGVVAPAMATKSTQSDYDEVHVKPLVKSEDAAKFDPNSSAKAESEVDASLRTHTKPIRVDVDLVLVPVTITDPMNRLVTGLQKENFILLDNGEKQAIEHFSSEDEPISLGVIFDTSGSMSNKIEKARAAVVEFFKTANPEDEFFMVAFNDKPTLICDFTNSVEAGAITDCVHGSKRTNGAAGCDLPRDCKDAPCQTPEEGAADHLRRGRQSQPVYGERN